jgi:hypothetical protein
MAPNRKSLTALAQTLSVFDLEGLQSTVQPKYLPLTHASVNTSEAATTTPVSQQPNVADTCSYWEWSADVETETVCVLSTANIVSNLIQASSAAAVTSSEQETLSENDDYWTEGEQSVEQAKPVTPSAPQHESASYWEWPAKDTSVPSSKSYWAWESTPVAAEYTEQEAADADYWAWEASSQDVAKLVMATTVLSQIKKQQQTESDNYGAWKGHHHDQYWDMPSTPAVVAAVAATGNKGYWDM